MCYPLPGPRCSAHAKATLKRAKTQYKTTPNETNLKFLQEAQAIYDTTPAGIAGLRAAGKNDLADQNEQLRKTQLELLKQDLRTKTHTDPQALKMTDKWLNDIRGEINTDTLNSTKELITHETANREKQQVDSVISFLADDPTGETVKGIAKNPNTPAETLIKLSTHDNKEVRAAVASNPKITPTLAYNLSRDKETQVKAALAGNPNTPANTLKYLAKEWSAWVQESVVKNPAATAEILSTARGTFKPNLKLKQLIAEHPNTSAETLHSLRLETPQILKRVIRHANTKPQTLLFIAQRHKNAELWQEILNHPNADDTIKEYIRTQPNA